MRGTRGSFILIGKPNLSVYLQGTMQGLGPFRMAGERLHRGHRVLLQVLHPLHRGIHPCQKGTQYLVQVVIKTITSGLRLSLSSRVVASRKGISCFASSNHPPSKSINMSRSRFIRAVEHFERGRGRGMAWLVHSTVMRRMRPASRRIWMSKSR